MGVFNNFPYANFHELNADWIIEQVRKVMDEWEEYKTDMDLWKLGVDDQLAEFQAWFDNLDVQDEVRTVMNELILSGEFIEITSPQIVSATEAWLSEHITPTTPAVDDTLSISGAAADAKVTGDRITDLKEDIIDTVNIVNRKNKTMAVLEEIGIINNVGVDAQNSNYRRTDFIDITDIDMAYIEYINTSGQYDSVFQYNSEKTFLVRTAYNISVPEVRITLNENCKYIRITHHKDDAINIYLNDAAVSKIRKSDIINLASIESLTEECLHHDNFSRTETGGVIGKNSENDLTDNSYISVSSDDLKVENGLTITANNSRPSNFTIQLINSEVSENILIETSIPNNGNIIYLITEYLDENNFKAFALYKAATYMIVYIVNIQNGNVQNIRTENIYNTVGYVLSYYQIGFQIMVKVDDKIIFTHTVDYKVNVVGLAGRKTNTANYKFFNVFNIKQYPIFDTAPFLMNNNSEMSNSILSTNPGNYSLSQERVFSCRYSEKFTLNSTDPLISNGKRCERSLSALYPKNLRTMTYKFRVLFPSTILPDADNNSYGDIFFQLHDRQAGVARGTVPFYLMLTANKIKLTQNYSSQQASGNLTNITLNKELAEIVYDKWMEFEVFIKERYDMNQNPHLVVKIDGNTVYESREPNCANDVNGSSAQYGEYKNQWSLITHSERYFDQMRVLY